MVRAYVEDIRIFLKHDWEKMTSKVDEWWEEGVMNSWCNKDLEYLFWQIEQ